MSFLRENCSFSHTGSQISVKISPGRYLFEVWGAQGGGEGGGKGGYSKGVISINKPLRVYVFVGGKGTRPEGGFNGGGDGGKGNFNSAGEMVNDGGGGGGSTDIRLNRNIESRIIVAGGGGGECYYWSSGGAGGDLEGGTSVNTWSQSRNVSSSGGSQTTGELLYGQDGINSTQANVGSEGNGGGGGGYRGGLSAQVTGDYSNIGGGGGSSFISGAKGCNIVENYTLRRWYATRH